MRSDWAGQAFSAFRHWAPAPEVKIDAPTEVAAPAPKKPVFVNPIIDLAGDPLIIRLGDPSEANTKLREVAVTPELKQPALSDGVEVLSDVMLSSSQRIMALPSSPEDFAFFQSQSARGHPRVSVEPVADEPVVDEPCQTSAEAEPVDPDAGGGAGAGRRTGRSRRRVKSWQRRRRSRSSRRMEFQPKA